MPVLLPRYLSKISHLRLRYCLLSVTPWPELEPRFIPTSTTFTFPSTFHQRTSILIRAKLKEEYSEETVCLLMLRWRVGGLFTSSKTGHISWTLQWRFLFAFKMPARTSEYQTLIRLLAQPHERGINLVRNVYCIPLPPRGPPAGMPGRRTHNNDASHAIQRSRSSTRKSLFTHCRVQRGVA